MLTMIGMELIGVLPFLSVANNHYPNKNERQQKQPEYDVDSNAERLARVEEQQEAQGREIGQLRELIAKCVTSERFRPVELIALGLAALVLVPVVTAVVAKVLQ